MSGPWTLAGWTRHAQSAFEGGVNLATERLHELATMSLARPVKSCMAQSGPSESAEGQRRMSSLATSGHQRPT